MKVKVTHKKDKPQIPKTFSWKQIKVLTGVFIPVDCDNCRIIVFKGSPSCENHAVIYVDINFSIVETASKHWINHKFMKADEDIELILSSAKKK